MCDCVQSSVIMAYGGPKSRKLGIARCNYTKPLSGMMIGARDCSVRKQNTLGIFRVFERRKKPFMNQRVCTSLGVFSSNEFEFSSELWLNEEDDDKFELGFQKSEGKLRNFVRDYKVDDMGRYSLEREKQPNNFEVKGSSKCENLVGAGNGKSGGLEEEMLLQPKGKQLIKRSSLIAKQVIGIESALSLGFVSQLWVDTTSWVVLEVEVRPNLLSSELGTFLLADIKQVGDVVLVQDKSVILNEFQTAGLETLVGYSVVTPRQRNLGKVRGYTFNINSGTVDSLELDAFGYSLIPTSLVSTYAMFTEDVLEVLSDTIIVQEAAASRIQRLTKGFLGTRNMESSSINLNYCDLEEEEEESIRPVKGRKSRRIKSSKRKFHPGMRDLDNDLELPMDYL